MALLPNGLVTRKTASKRNMPTTKCRAITSFCGLKVEERWTITYKCFAKNVTTIKVISNNHCRWSISGSLFETCFCLRLVIHRTLFPQGPVFSSANTSFPAHGNAILNMSQKQEEEKVERKILEECRQKNVIIRKQIEKEVPLVSLFCEKHRK